MERYYCRRLLNNRDVVIKGNQVKLHWTWRGRELLEPNKQRICDQRIKIRWLTEVEWEAIKKEKRC